MDVELKTNNMPGKSKKGGGLEVGSAYKMKGFSGFGNSPMKTDPRHGMTHQTVTPPEKKKKSNKLTLKGEGSVRSRVEGFFSKFRGDAKKAFVGPGKLFRRRKGKATKFTDKDTLPKD